ncbi:MAG: glycerophosphodiester phosphodiesterase [Terriglobales bacterium]
MNETARPLLLGHRGARRYAPENTLEAFELALGHGCDGFEFDVRLTADNRCIVCHDARLGGHVVSRSRYDRLPAAPCLPDVLAAFADRAFLDIELKVTGLETDVTEALRSNPPRRGFCVSSFLPAILIRLHDLDNTLPLGLICNTGRQLARWRALPVQSVFLECGLALADVVGELHAAGKNVYVWTVNPERQMRQFAELGVEGIISDDTKLLARTLSQWH